VEAGIRNALPVACQRSFDVFVPGTAAEHGAWKQFNSMFSRETGRGYLSLQYQNGTDFDATQYDLGVIDARSSLISLLYTLKSRFADSDVRVFGHSKGSHAVALVADEPDYRGMKFFAFAQPGRTATDISNRGDINAGKRGSPGFIHKLSDNLVGITWANDEVQFYVGDGFNGLMMPEKWGWPGFIWQDTASGTVSPLRIDHHNNYGGRYTDGVPGNRWQDGQGSTDNAYPYCATGHKFELLRNDELDECGKHDKHDVEFLPYFWGDAGCREKTFEIMNSGAVGAKHYIGYSGPRSADCRDNVGTVQASYRLEYNLNLADQDDCRYDMTLRFEGRRFDDAPYTRPSGGSIRVRSTVDTGWRSITGTILLPYHMRIYLTASMAEVSSNFWRDCGHLTAASEGYIRSLVVTFTHPVSGKRTTRTLIGLGEGQDYPYPIKLDGNNNVAWWKWDDPSDSRDTWDLFYAPWPWSALMIKGDTDENRRGHFYKWLHLVD